jgi:hypothetical protein
MTRGALRHSVSKASALARALRSTYVYGSVYICSVGVENAAGPSSALALSFPTDVYSHFKVS